MSSYTKPNDSPIYDPLNFFKPKDIINQVVADKRYVQIQAQNINQEFTRKVGIIGDCACNTITLLYNSLPIFRTTTMGYVERVVTSIAGTLNTTNQNILSINILKKGVYIIYGTLKLGSGAVNLKVDLEILIQGVSDSGNNDYTDSFGVLVGSSQEYPSTSNSKTIDTQSFFRCDSVSQIVNLRASINTSTLAYEEASLQIIRIA